jgi:outer membrane protein TolC
LAHAPLPAYADPALTFDAARTRLLMQSPKIAAASDEAASQQHVASATKTLRLPYVSLSAGELDYQKTVYPSSGAVNSGIQNAISGLGIPPSLLPGLSAVPPIALSQTATSPSVAGVLPLFTGGRISAIQGIAQTAADQAETDRNGVAQDEEVLLVTRYIGVQATAWATRAADEASYRRERSRGGEPSARGWDRARCAVHSGGP